LEIDRVDDIEIIRRVVEERCQSAGKKVKAIVDYESFSIGENLLDAYLDMGKYIIETYYQDVTRHTTSQRLRSRLGDEFVKRGLAPSIYESEQEAEIKILI
jgi:propionate CoA-transferase